MNTKKFLYKLWLIFSLVGGLLLIFLVSFLDSLLILFLFSGYVIFNLFFVYYFKHLFIKKDEKTNNTKTSTKNLNPPLIVGNENTFLEKTEKKTTQIYLLAKQGNLEIIRQVIAKDKVFLIKGENNIFEHYFLLKGEIIREKNKEILTAGNFITVQNTTSEIYFKTKTECTILFVTTSPIFDSKQKEFSKLLDLNKQVEKKDRQTKEHCSRLEKLSLKTGEILGLKEEHLFKLDYASILHDIGKINVSSSILKKKDKLNKKEWNMIERHPSWGKKIISENMNISFFKEVAEIIYQHHEHYDGSGYPQGLKGEEILKESQILSVVDSFDAMVTDRPYQKASSIEEAIEELKKEKGKQFSPEVVDAFLKIDLDKIL